MPPQVLQLNFTITLDPFASTTISHGIKLADGRNIAPNWVWPDRGTPIGVTAVTDTQVTFENPSSDTQEATFLIRLDHTIQRGLSESASVLWRGSTLGNLSGAVQPLFGTYSGPSAPPDPIYARDSTKSTIHVYIRSNVTSAGGVQLIPGAFPGDDDNDGLTPQTPLQSLQGLYKKFPPGAYDGGQIIVHLAGSDGPNNGFDGPCQVLLTYRASTVIINNGDPNGSSYRYVGPKGMALSGVGNLGPILGQANVGRLSRLTFNGPFGVDALLFGNFLRITKADGNKLYPEIPIHKNTATQVFLPDGGRAGLFPVDATYEVVQAAAFIHPFDAITDFAGVLVIGSGTYREGRVLTTTPAEGINSAHTMERIGIVGPIFIHTGTISLDRVDFHDHNVICNGGGIAFYNCRADANVAVFSFGRTLALQDALNENAARADSATDPQFPTIGVDLYIRLGSLLLGGHGVGVNLDDGGHHSGHYRVYKGLALYNNPSASFGALHMTDHSSFFCDDQANLIIDTTAIGIMIKNKAECRIRQATLYANAIATAEIRSVTDGYNTIVVDETFANWANAAIWNKNFCTYKPQVLANAYGAGIPAATIPPTGCHARVYE